MTNTELLEKKISERGLKYKYIAEKLGITYFSLQKKINNVTEFKASEIDIMCEILGIDDTEERMKIFFAKW